MADSGGGVCVCGGGGGGGGGYNWENVCAFEYARSVVLQIF